MITNPENLSKDRLKAELKKHGIRFNHNENKPYYVELYRRKVQVEPIRAPASEFSDEEYKPSPKPKKKMALSGRRKQSKAMETYLTHVQTLTDSELREGLLRMGEDPGPINPSTRSVYENKLAKLLEEEKAERDSTPVKSSPVRPSQVSAEDSFVAEWSDEDEEEEESGSIGAADDQDDEVAESEPVRSSRQYNLRRRHYQAEEVYDGGALDSRHHRSDKPKPPRSSPPRHSKIKPSSPMTRHFEPPSAGAKRRRRVPEEGSDACRVAWSILFVLIVFATVFLLYEHFTVPPGKTSLLVAGVEGVRSTVYTWISPLMEKQEAEPEKKTAPPMTPPTARPPSKQDSPPPPPPTTTTTTTKPAEKTKKEEPKPSKEEPKPNKEEPKPREEDKEGTKKSKKQPKTNKKTTSESSTEKVH